MSNKDHVNIDMGNLIVHNAEMLEGISEENVIAKAKQSVALLIKSLYDLKKTQKNKDFEYGQYEVELPDKLLMFPRQFPLPKAKPMTKWERFKKLRDIRQPKKRSRLVYDDITKQWVPRWGKGSKKKIEKEANWITEDKN